MTIHHCPFDFPVPPVFTLLPEDTEVMTGGRIHLECAAEGSPTPVITWHVNNTDYPCQFDCCESS